MWRDAVSRDLQRVLSGIGVLARAVVAAAGDLGAARTEPGLGVIGFVACSEASCVRDTARNENRNRMMRADSRGAISR